MPVPEVNTKNVSDGDRGFRSLFHGGPVDIPLPSRGRKLVLLLAVGIPAAFLALKVTQTVMAARLGSGMNPQDLRQAIALDPGNAAYDYKMGLIDSYSLRPASLRNAVRYLRKATELNPRKALYWSDLAEVCDMLDDTACSNPAVERALALSPMTPRFEWRAGNHDLEAGHTGEALEHFRRLLSLDSTYAQPVFRVCLGVVGNPETVFQKVLPSDAKPQLKLAYLDVVSAQGNLRFADKVWSQISSEGFACKLSDVKPYLERLIHADDIRQAAGVWHDLEQAGVIPRPAAGDEKNLVYNGGFEHTPLNTGFGWYAPNIPYVETDFRDPSAYQGSRCLRVDYARGQNLKSEAVYQLIPVQPNQTYQLQAYVRSDDITSKSGPRLRVVDPECPACLNVSTQTTVGTTAWHGLTLNFMTGPRTQLIRLSVWRPRCWTFPMEISGSFWLDEVSMKAVNSMPKETASAR